MNLEAAMTAARAQSKSSGQPYAVTPSGDGFAVRQKKGFFEKLPKGSCTVYPSGKVFPPTKGSRARSTCRVARKGKKNPFGYIVAGRTQPHVLSETPGLPFKDRSQAIAEAKEVIRRKRRRGEDVSFDMHLVKGRRGKERTVKIRPPAGRMAWNRSRRRRGFHYGPGAFRRGFVDARAFERIKAPVSPLERGSKPYSKGWGTGIRAAQKEERQRGKNPFYRYRHRKPGPGHSWQYGSMHAMDIQEADNRLYREYRDKEHVDIYGIKEGLDDPVRPIMRKVLRVSPRIWKTRQNANRRHVRNAIQKMDAVKRFTARAINEGWWLDKAVDSALAFKQRNEDSREIRDYVRSEYAKAGLDSRGRKTSANPRHRYRSRSRRKTQREKVVTRLDKESRGRFEAMEKALRRALSKEEVKSSFGSVDSQGRYRPPKQNRRLRNPYEATKVGAGRYLVRPRGALGTAGWIDGKPWAAKRVSARTAEEATRKATRRSRARNPDVWLEWTQRGHSVKDPTGRGLHPGRALWRKGLSKGRARKEARRAGAYARRQKDWVQHRVVTKNRRRRRRNPELLIVRNNGRRKARKRKSRR